MPRPGTTPTSASRATRAASSSLTPASRFTTRDTVFDGTAKPRPIEPPVGADPDAAPGTSPIKLVAKLPGVNFQSADAFGAYEWSTRISIRGFNQNQLGFTLDGIPLGDMTYGNHNGLHISRAVSSENVESVVVSQGAGSLTTQSTNALGGTIETEEVDA